MPSILLVEDDPLLIDIYSKKFKEAGFDLEVISEGAAVMSALENKMFALVLLDIVLPKVEGWQILKEIKQNQKLKQMKVVILSNLGQKEEVEKGLNLGADKYLIKSHFKPSEIVAQVKEILAKENAF